MKSLKKVDYLVVHCSATAEGRPFRANDLRRWHVRGNGWEDIGYHFVIGLDGRIERGRPTYFQGAHCKGLNSCSLGICYVGGLAADGKTPKDTRTPEQRAALFNLLRELKQDYPNARIVGHRDFAPKDCPSFDATTEYAGL